jgi:ADP-ribose pyrophosphatase
LHQGGWEIGNVDTEEIEPGERKEELGLNASEMIYLGAMWIAHGYSNQKQHVFPATGLLPTEANPHPEDQDLITDSVTISESEKMMADGAIRDCCTPSAWGLYPPWKARQ